MKKNIKINKKEITVKDENTELTYEIKTIIAIFLLVTAYPVGVVLMFMWMKWPTWVKELGNLTPYVRKKGALVVRQGAEKRVWELFIKNTALC